MPVFTNSSRFSLTIIAALLLMVSTSSAQNDTVTISASGKKIKVSFPGDLVPKKTELTQLVNQMRKGAPTNTIHEVFAEKKVTAKTLETGLKRNGDVQTVNQVPEASQELFNQVKELLTNQFDQLLKQAAGDIKDRTGVTFKTQEKVGKGVFVDEKDRFAYLMFSTIDAGGGKKVERVTAACVCFLKDRLILMNLHSNLDSEKDAEWVKSSAKAWIKKVCELNPNDDN